MPCEIKKKGLYCSECDSCSSCCWRPEAALCFPSGEQGIECCVKRQEGRISLVPDAQAGQELQQADPCDATCRCTSDSVQRCIQRSLRCLCIQALLNAIIAYRGGLGVEVITDQVKCLFGRWNAGLQMRISSVGFTADMMRTTARFFFYFPFGNSSFCFFLKHTLRGNRKGKGLSI